MGPCATETFVRPPGGCRRGRLNVLGPGPGRFRNSDRKVPAYENGTHAAGEVTCGKHHEAAE